jgi:hypothetical protein
MDHIQIMGPHPLGLASLSLPPPSQKSAPQNQNKKTYKEVGPYTKEISNGAGIAYYINYCSSLLEHILLIVYTLKFDLTLDFDFHIETEFKFEFECM